MITNRRYFEDKIAGVEKEVRRLNDFNEKVYTTRHEELEKRVIVLEKAIGETQATDKTFNQLRTRFYSRITLVIGAITVIAIIIDQIFIDHILH